MYFITSSVKIDKMKSSVKRSRPVTGSLRLESDDAYSLSGQRGPLGTDRTEVLYANVIHRVSPSPRLNTFTQQHRKNLTGSVSSSLSSMKTSVLYISRSSRFHLIIMHGLRPRKRLRMRSNRAHQLYVRPIPSSISFYLTEMSYPALSPSK